MSANTRIYVVGGTAIETPRLVKASTQAQALNHVVSSLFKVEVASQDQLVDLAGRGVKVEAAGANPQPQAQPQG